MASSATDYVEGPRHGIITDDNVGPIISIITLLFMVTMVLAVILRILVRFTTSLVPGADDGVILLALLTALGEVIAIAVSVNNGLGRRESLLSADQLSSVQKGVYAASLLYILTIALGKISTLLLLHRLTVSARHRLVVWVTAGAIVAWTPAALFGAAFQCHLPDPWVRQGSRCFDITTFWNIIGAFDVLIDLGLMAFPIWIVWALQMPARRKVVVVMGFAFRLSLCVVQVVRIVYLNRTLDGVDEFHSSLSYILAMQFQTTLAVAVACIPAYKVFMDRAASGLMSISFEGREGTYQLSSINKSHESKQRSREPGNASADRGNGYYAEISANGDMPGQIDRVPRRDVDWEIRQSDESRLNPRRGRLLGEDEGYEQEASRTQSSISLAY